MKGFLGWRMNTVKMILIVLGLVFAAVLAFLALGLVITAVKYLIFIGVILVGGVLAFKLLKNPERPQLETTTAERELEKARRALEEYKRGKALKP